MAKPNARADTFFDLSMRGGLPEILREIAKRVESGEVDADQFHCDVSRDHFKLTVDISLHPKQ